MGVRVEAGKFKQCCLQARASEDSERLRLRGAEDRVMGSLMEFVTSTWSASLLGYAWGDFWNFEDVPEDLFGTPEFQTMFMPAEAGN